MKVNFFENIKTFFSCAIVFFAMNQVFGQVNIQGDIQFSTTWTKALSPYSLVGDVQVPSGVVLTIEPGVEIIYTGNYELLVKGQLIANGTALEMIVFHSDEEGVKKDKRFLNFSATDLSTHALSYIKMEDGNVGIQVGDEGEHSQGNKNTGRLIVSHIDFTNTNVKTSGYGTGADLLLSDGIFESGEIKGDYPRSEKILLNNITINNSTLFSDSYNNGIWLDGCDLSNTILSVGCCGANFNINDSTIEGGTFGETNNYYDVTISNSRLINHAMNLSTANSISLTNSVISLGLGQVLKLKNLTMDGVSLNGQGTGAGMELTGVNQIERSTISGFDIGVKINSGSGLSVLGSNFSDNGTYHIQNTSNQDVAATENWWGTTDVASINELIFDKNDDINYGEVLFNPLFMMEGGELNYIPIVDNFITPLIGQVPLEVLYTSTATDVDGTIENYQWDFDGDKVYDFSSNVNGDTSFIYNNGGDFVVESSITDDKDLANRLFYKIAVIDFNSQSDVIDTNEIMVNWGWGSFHSVVIDAAALNMLSDGDIINVYDYDGFTSNDCFNSDERGKQLLATQLYSKDNDSVYVFNCAARIDKCSFNSTIKSGYKNGNQIFFEIQEETSSYEIIPSVIKSGEIVFTDSEVTYISAFETTLPKSGKSNGLVKKSTNVLKSVGSNDITYDIYRNNVLIKEGVSDLYFIDRDLELNTEYCYDIYLVNKGIRALSKSTCTQNIALSNLDFINDLKFDVYPNPSKELITVEMSKLFGNGKLIIYDITGKKLFSHVVKNSKAVININSLTSGVYIIKYSQNEYNEVRKFVKE